MIRGGAIFAATAAAAVLTAAAPRAQDDQYAFMPDGGRGLLAGVIGGLAEPDALEVLRRRASAEDWSAWALARDPGLDEAALRTFADYAALNLPVAESALEGLASGAGLASALPPDGKDLAVAQCQFCHALFSGYLMHERDRTGWLSTFKTPFHKEIPMTEVERETFAAYSAINMPLTYDEVPPELRF